jgi:hypothetical protein
VDFDDDTEATVTSVIKCLSITSTDDIELVGGEIIAQLSIVSKMDLSEPGGWCRCHDVATRNGLFGLNGALAADIIHWIHQMAFNLWLAD